MRLNARTWQSLCVSVRLEVQKWLISSVWPDEPLTFGGVEGVAERAISGFLPSVQDCHAHGYRLSTISRLLHLPHPFPPAASSISKSVSPFGGGPITGKWLCEAGKCRRAMLAI